MTPPVARTGAQLVALLKARLATDASSASAAAAAVAEAARRPGTRRGMSTSYSIELR